MLAQLVECRVDVFHIQVVRATRLRKSQVDEKRSLQQPVERQDVVDLLSEEVDHGECCERCPVDEPLGVIICNVGMG